MEYRKVTPHQRGGIGEALVESHWYEMYEILGKWAVSDLREHEGEPVTSSDDLRVKYRALDKWAKYHAGNNEEMTWMPDCRYKITVLTRQTNIGEERVHMAPPSYDYLLEVKTGTSSTLKRDQRDVMEALEESDERVIPVRVRIDIERLPDEYGIHLTRIHGRH